jgi:magnesium-transporting ATPase (P-type)
VANNGERGRVPRYRAGRLVGWFALSSAALTFVTLLLWSNDAPPDALKPALWATGCTALSSVLLLVWAGGVWNDIMKSFETESSDSRARDHSGHEPPKEFANKNGGLYYALLATIILSLAATVAFTGGLIRSPFAQVFVGSFILGQVLSPNTRTVWYLFAMALATAVLCQFAYWLLEFRWPWYPELAVPGLAYLFPGLLTALASTLFNRASVGYRQAMAARTTLASPDLPASGDQTPTS